MNVIAAMRGIMALIIVITHVHQLFHPLCSANMARIVVVIFFVMSGYFMASSIQKNIHKNGIFNWHQYVVLRIKKIIFPLFLIIVLSSLLYEIFIFIGFPISYHGIVFMPKIGVQLLSIFTLGLYGNLNPSMAYPFWFMTALIRCYTVMGILYFVFLSKCPKPVKIFVIFFMIFYIIRSLRIHFLTQDEISYNIYYMGYLCFMFGVSAHYIKDFLLKYRYLLLGFSFLIFCGIYFFLGNWSDENIPIYLFWETIIGLMFSLIIPALQTIRIPYISLLKGLSDISYQIYIIHQPINVIMGIIFYAYLGGDENNDFLMYLPIVGISVLAAIMIKNSPFSREKTCD